MQMAVESTRRDGKFGFKGFSELKLFSNRIFMNHYPATSSSDDLCLETSQKILLHQACRKEWVDEGGGRVRAGCL